MTLETSLSLSIGFPAVHITVLIHSPAVKTWTSLKENGGEKKDIKEIKTVLALTSEIRWWQGPRQKKGFDLFLLPVSNL